MGYPDERLGERACAYVRLRDGASFSFERDGRPPRGAADGPAVHAGAAGDRGRDAADAQRQDPEVQAPRDGTVTRTSRKPYAVRTAATPLHDEGGNTMTSNRRSLLKAGVAFAAATVSTAGAARAQGANTIKLGVADRHGGCLPRPCRAEFGRGGAAGGPGVRRPGLQGGGPLRRPPEQVRHRLEHRAQWFDRDGVDAVVDVPAAPRPSPSPASRARRTRCSWPPGPAPRNSRRRSAARTRCTGPTTPTCWRNSTGAAGQARRRQLVLRHGRLRLRPSMEAETTRFVTGRRRQGAGLRALPLPRRRPISPPSCCARRRAGRRSSAFLGGGGPRQRGEAGGRIRPQPARRASAALIVFITEVQSLGLKAAQGLL